MAPTMSDLEQTIEQYHLGGGAFTTGDAEPNKELFSRRDDVTLANPLGPAVRGRDQVEQTLDGAASRLREGEPIRFERIAEYATADLAYTVETERYRMKVGDADEMVPVALRV